MTACLPDGISWWFENVSSAAPRQRFFFYLSTTSVLIRTWNVLLARHAGRGHVIWASVVSSKFLDIVCYLFFYVWHDCWIYVSIQFGAILDEISSAETWKIPINGDKGLSENAFIVYKSIIVKFPSICLLSGTFGIILIYWIFLYIENCAFDCLCLKLLVDNCGSKSLLLQNLWYRVNIIYFY